MAVVQIFLMGTFGDEDRISQKKSKTWIVYVGIIILLVGGLLFIGYLPMITDYMESGKFFTEFIIGNNDLPNEHYGLTIQAKSF